MREKITMISKKTVLNILCLAYIMRHIAAVNYIDIVNRLR